MDVVLFTAVAGVAAFALAASLIPRLRAMAMASGAAAGRELRTPLLLRLAGSRAIAPLARGMPPSLEGLTSYLDRRVEAAGFPNEGGGRGLLALLACASIGCALALFVSSGGSDPLAAFGGAASAVAAPLAWLARRARIRRMEIERRMPFALDMLMLCVEAGSDLAQAMVGVSERLGGGPLGDELSRVSLALRTGASRRDALGLLCARRNPRQLARLAKLLMRADRTGVGVGRILRSASARLTDERFAGAERLGAHAAQKLLAPLILCIMPATFLVVFGPLAVRLASGGVGGLML